MGRKIPEFTAKELDYFRNTDFLKTKRLIIKGFIDLFENIQVDILQSIARGNFQLPEGINGTSGKITKGENYKDLPFVVLDCPRFFGKSDIFAYRSIFWWGNYLSNHFLLKGKYLDRYREEFSKSWPFLKEEDLYLDLSIEPWNHDLSTSEYIHTSQLDEKRFDEILHRPEFLKLVWRTELHQWKAFHQRSIKNLQMLLKILNI